MEQLAQEYARSAELLKQRIDELKHSGMDETYRVALLSAEYHHLMKVSNYLAHYYEHLGVNGFD